MQKQYRAGEVLFGEGEPSDYACRIVSGEADIVKNNAGEAVVLGTAKAGDFIGEMGVIEGSPRSATIRAVSAVTVEIYPKDAFLKRISEDNEMALRLLSRLSQRLRVVSQAFVEAVTIGGSGLGAGEPEGGATGTLRPLRMFADSNRLEGQLPSEGVLVNSLPFFVGRSPKEAEPKPGIPVDLALEDKQPYRLSRVHFSIDSADGSYLVRDMHSMLGTNVNGDGLGDHFTADQAFLSAAENIVVAGGKVSPYRFRLVVEA